MIDTLLDRPIAFHREFVSFAGVLGAVMLSQSLYWSKRTTLPDKWFYKTRDEWQEETGLSRRAQETAREQLVKIGVLEEKLAGVPAKLHFKVNYDVLTSWLTKNEATPPQKERTNKLVQENQAQIEAKKPAPTIYTEITTETTTKEKINQKENSFLDSNSSSPPSSESPPSSKNAILPLTDLEKWEMAKELDVPLWVIKQTDKNFWNYIELPKNKKKYKTSYRTIKHWVEMGVQRGDFNNCNEVEKLELDSQHPERLAKVKEVFDWWAEEEKKKEAKKK